MLDTIATESQDVDFEWHELSDKNPYFVVMAGRLPLRRVDETETDVEYDHVLEMLGGKMFYNGELVETAEERQQRLFKSYPLAEGCYIDKPAKTA